jgi:hypothetical protein
MSEPGQPTDLADGESAASAELILKLAPAATSASSPAYRAVRAFFADLGISVSPLHPSTSDPELASYLVAHVDPAAADRVIERLVECEGVEGAYAKPAGQPPEGRVHDAG